MGTIIPRGIHPSEYLSSQIRTMIDSNYPDYKTNPTSGRSHAHFLHLLMFNTSSTFQHKRRKVIDERVWSRRWVMTWDTRLQRISFNFRIISSAIKVCRTVSTRYDTAVDCKKSLLLRQELINDYTLEILDGMNDYLTAVDLSEDEQNWIGLDNPEYIIPSSNDWDHSSTIFSNDYDRISKRIIYDNNDNDNDSDVINESNELQELSESIVDNDNNQMIEGEDVDVSTNLLS